MHSGTKVACTTPLTTAITCCPVLPVRRCGKYAPQIRRCILKGRIASGSGWFYADMSEELHEGVKEGEGANELTVGRISISMGLHVASRLGPGLRTACSLNSFTSKSQSTVGYSTHQVLYCTRRADMTDTTAMRGRGKEDTRPCAGTVAHSAHALNNLAGTAAVASTANLNWTGRRCAHSPSDSTRSPALQHAHRRPPPARAVQKRQTASSERAGLA